MTQIQGNSVESPIFPTVKADLLLVHAPAFFDFRDRGAKLAEQRESAKFRERVAALDLVQELLAGHRAGPEAPVKTRDSRAPMR